MQVKSRTRCAHSPARAIGLTSEAGPHARSAADVQGKQDERDQGQQRRSHRDESEQLKCAEWCGVQSKLEILLASWRR